MLDIVFAVYRHRIPGYGPNPNDIIGFFNTKEEAEQYIEWGKNQPINPVYYDYDKVGDWWNFGIVEIPRMVGYSNE